MSSLRELDLGKDLHVLPVPGDHAESRSCWCEPSLYQLCPECGPEPERPASGCWRCPEEPGQLVEPYMPLRSCVVIHSEPRYRKQLEQS